MTTTSTKTLDIPNEETLRALVSHAIHNKWSFGGALASDKWTLAIPADRYGEFLRLRNTLAGLGETA